MGLLSCGNNRLALGIDYVGNEFEQPCIVNRRPEQVKGKSLAGEQQRDEKMFLRMWERVKSGTQQAKPALGVKGELLFLSLKMLLIFKKLIVVALQCCVSFHWTAEWLNHIIHIVAGGALLLRPEENRDLPLSLDY